MPGKKGVAKAHEKHKHDHLCALPSSPTLADRFFALPAEIRNTIYALLLVQPAKWDLQHQPACDLRSTPLTYSLSHAGPDSSCCWNCANCGHYGFELHYSDWRHEPRESWISPWRSVWAPEIRNPYLCSRCYDERWRERPCPRAAELSCLCPRRAELQVLLVCKRFYDEAGHVFYTENTFAFENSSSFVSFFGNLAPRWRDSVSKVSLLAFKTPATAQEAEEDWEPSTRLAPVWSLLRRLPSLSQLELDALFLTRLKTVRAMRKLGMRNLRAVRFVQHRYDEEWATRCVPGEMAFVWPNLAVRTMVEDGFAGQIARKVKGQRREWEWARERGGKDVLQRAVIEERRRQGIDDGGET